MIEPSEGNQIKQDHLQILDAILQKIQDQGQSKGFNLDKNVSIFVSKDLAYKGVIGQEPSKNILTPDSVETLNKALLDPQNFKGSIRIMIGQEKVYHASRGEVSTDRLSLSPKQSQSTTLAPVKIESLQQQINTLQQRVQEQQKLVDSLNFKPQQGKFVSQLETEFTNLKELVAQQQQTMEKLQQRLESSYERNLPLVKNSSLQNWVGSIETKVKQTAINLLHQIKDTLTPKIEKLSFQVNELRSDIDQQISRLDNEIQQMRSSVESHVEKNLQSVRDTAVDVQHKVSQKVQSVHTQVTKAVADAHSLASNTISEGVNTVSRSMMEAKGKAIQKSVGAMLHLFGERHLDGSTTFESQNYNFHQQGSTITIKSKDGRDVLVDGNLTSDATAFDVSALEKVGEVIDEHLNQNLNSEQSKNRFRSR